MLAKSTSWEKLRERSEKHLMTLMFPLLRRVWVDIEHRLDCLS